MTSSSHAVDLAQLNRYTGGNRALNVEILGLFASQCTEMLERLEQAAQAADSKSWKEITHALKGSARGVGAFLLGDAAAAAEKLAGQQAGLREAVIHIRSQSAAVQRFIAEFLEAAV